MPRGGLGRLAARGLGVTARLLQLGGRCPRARARGPRSGRARPRPRRRSDPRPRRWRASPGPAPPRRASWRRRLHQRAERDDRAGRQVVVLEVSLAADGGVDPVDDGAMARWSCLSALPRGAAISSASRKPLNSRLWLIPTGTNVSFSSSSVPSLRRTTVWTDAAVLGHVAGDRERLDERAPEHARAGPAEQLLGGPAPARDRAVAIRKHEAGIDELTQQLLDGLRLGGRGTRLLLGHLIFRVGAGRRYTTLKRIAVGYSSRRKPCSSAPFTPASSAFRRYRASASAERKRRPGSASGAVVGQDAVGDRVQLRLGEAVERARPLRDELLAERHVAHQRARLAAGRSPRRAGTRASCRRRGGSRR